MRQSCEKKSADIRLLICGDVISLKSILDAEAIYIHSPGVVDSQVTFLQAVHRGDVQYDRMEVHVFKINRIDTNAVMLSGAAVTDGNFYGEELRLDELFIMTWLKRREGWKLSSYQTTPFEPLPDDAQRE